VQQTIVCPKCGTENDVHFQFCTACGEKLIGTCPVCGREVNFSFKYCVYCGTPLRGRQAGTVSNPEPSEKMKQLLNDIRIIGELKNTLPMNQQHWCDILGLHVWYRDLDRYTHGVDGAWIKAGGKHSTKLEGWTDRKKFWEIKTYKHGNWESLIKPTLQIAEWLYRHGGLPVEEQDDFLKSVRDFRKTGKLVLP
jgi:hypothetical protein